MRHARHNWRWLFRHMTPCAFSLPLLSAGSRRAARMAIIAITTSNSISVKAWNRDPRSPGEGRLICAACGMLGNYSPAIRAVQSQGGGWTAPVSRPGTRSRGEQEASKRLTTGLQLACNFLATAEALRYYPCLLYTSDAADEEDSVDLG